MAHNVHAMHMMFHICDKFADEFDTKFNNVKSVAIRNENRYSERCATLQLQLASELKYLGVHVTAAKHFKFSVWST